MANVIKYKSTKTEQFKVELSDLKIRTENLSTFASTPPKTLFVISNCPSPASLIA